MLVTTCPGCQTTFKVTVAILEKAGGQVRCGRCAHVFDANVNLREHAATETQDIARIADTISATGSRWILQDAPPYQMLWVLLGEYDRNFNPPYGHVLRLVN